MLKQSIIFFLVIAASLNNIDARSIGASCGDLEGKFACADSEFLVCSMGKWQRQNLCKGKCSEDPATSAYCAVTMDGGSGPVYNTPSAMNSREVAEGIVKDQQRKTIMEQIQHERSMSEDKPQRRASPPPPPQRAPPMMRAPKRRVTYFPKYYDDDIYDDMMDYDYDM